MACDVYCCLSMVYAASLIINMQHADQWQAQRKGSHSLTSQLNSQHASNHQPDFQVHEAMPRTVRCASMAVIEVLPAGNRCADRSVGRISVSMLSNKHAAGRSMQGQEQMGQGRQHWLHLLYVCNQQCHGKLKGLCHLLMMMMIIVVATHC